VRWAIVLRWQPTCNESRHSRTTPMETSLFNRVQATLLALATAGLILLAVLNFRQETEFQQPDDGVWWREGRGGLEAAKVLPDSPGSRAGIQQGDLLTGADVLRDDSSLKAEQQQDSLPGEKPLTVPQSSEASSTLAMPKNPIVRIADLEHVLYRTGVYGKAVYALTRGGVPLDTPVEIIPFPLDRGLAQAQRAIGLVYLAIGIYVLFRRWGAARATHFYLFCLVSFALCTLKYTGELNLLDWIVFWMNVAAEALQPALFLHFALSFPEERLKGIRRRWLLPLVYAPGIALLGLWIWAVETRQATALLKHSL
jgi:two-component system NtrC family sensor kinase